MPDYYDTIRIDDTGGVLQQIPLEEIYISIITRYNYLAEAWCMDIYDEESTLLVSGLMLFPDIDILYPFPDLKETIGSLVLIEKNVGDHKLANNFGANTRLLWFAPGETIELPE